MQWEQKVFRELTEVELKMNSKLSKYLCSECDTTMQNFYKFREDCMAMQKKYYEFVDDQTNQEGFVDEDDEIPCKVPKIQIAPVQSLLEPSATSTDSTKLKRRSEQNLVETIDDNDRNQHMEVTDCAGQFEFDAMQVSHTSTSIQLAAKKPPARVAEKAKVSPKTINAASVEQEVLIKN